MHRPSDIPSDDELVQVWVQRIHQELLLNWPVGQPWPTRTDAYVLPDGMRLKCDWLLPEQLIDSIDDELRRHHWRLWRQPLRQHDGGLRSPQYKSSGHAAPVYYFFVEPDTECIHDFVSRYTPTGFCRWCGAAPGPGDHIRRDLD